MAQSDPNGAVGGHKHFEGQAVAYQVRHSTSGSGHSGCTRLRCKTTLNAVHTPRRARIAMCLGYMYLVSGLMLTPTQRHAASAALSVTLRLVSDPAQPMQVASGCVWR